MTKKILVTGGTGYIGSHTVVELQLSGYQVVVIDDLRNSDIKILEQINHITHRKAAFGKVDLCDEKELNTFLNTHRDIVGVIHFAALKAVGQSVEHPLEYYRNNLVSLINLLNAMKRMDISNLVFSSSCTVYGEPDQLPVNELAPVKQALSPYGNTKQIAEEIIDDTVAAGKLKAISLRYFNPIGAHESALIGELPLGVPDNLVPYITQTAIGKRKQLSIFGNDYDTPDGTCIRDYIHVTDLAQAHIVALERLFSNQGGKPYEVYNIGTGKGYSVLQAIKAFEQQTGVKLNYKFAPRRPGDVPKVWADTTLANILLGWKAKKGLEEMMASAWNWEKNLASGIMD
jgi:UDP-glucose 4-epimerase